MVKRHGLREIGGYTFWCLCGEEFSHEGRIGAYKAFNRHLRDRASGDRRTAQLTALRTLRDRIPAHEIAALAAIGEMLTAVEDRVGPAEEPSDG